MDDRKHKQWVNALETAARRAPHKVTIYTIKPGDTLSRIILNHYRAFPNDANYRIALASILEYNRHIKQPDNIRAGDTLRLMPLPDSHALRQCPVPEPGHPLKKTHWSQEPIPYDRSVRIRDAMPKEHSEQEAFTLLSSLEESHGIISAALGGGINAFGNLVGQGNEQQIKEIKTIYEDFKAGKMTRNQYDYRRQKVIKELARKMGPMLDKEKLRISRKQGISPTASIERHANRIAKLSRYATKSGIVLAGVGVAMSCRDIANTDNRQEKNEILVETAASTTIGFATSAAMGVILFSNPVGWGVAIVLGVGTAALSFAAGKGAAKFYGINLNEYDFVSGLGVDELCK